MFANNEIGTIQDIKTLCDISHSKGALFHTDAVQAVGHMHIDVKNLELICCLHRRINLTDQRESDSYTLKAELLSSLTDFGASEEVAEVIQSFMNGKAASRLVKKALEHGVEFSAQEVMDMIDLLDDIPEELISSCKTHFSQEQMDILIDYDIDEDVLRAASKKSIRSANMGVCAAVI